MYTITSNNNNNYDDDDDENDNNENDDDCSDYDCIVLYCIQSIIYIYARFIML